MARATTALTVYEIPGRARGSVRVHRPAEGKASFRVVWTDDGARQRERTYPSLEIANAAAATLAESLALSVAVGGAAADTFEHILDHYLYGDGMSKQWRSERSARRPRQLARRYLLPEDLSMSTAALAGHEGIAFCNQIMARFKRPERRPGLRSMRRRVLCCPPSSTWLPVTG